MRTTGHRTATMLDAYSGPRALFDGSAASYFVEVQPGDYQLLETSR